MQKSIEYSWTEFHQLHYEIPQLASKGGVGDMRSERSYPKSTDTASDLSADSNESKATVHIT